VGKAIKLTQEEPRGPPPAGKLDLDIHLPLKKGGEGGKNLVRLLAKKKKRKKL